MFSSLWTMRTALTLSPGADLNDSTVQWEERRDDRVKFRKPAAPGSRTITARSMRRHIQQRWAALLVGSIHQAGFQSCAVWACLRTLGAGSADRAGLSTAGTLSGPPSNTPCPSKCAFYRPPPPPPGVCAPGPFLCSCGSTIFADERYALPLPC